ncbi:isoleucine--tRNA ligase [Pyrobaculum aerophilum]|uniref:Isoleucine--tRNA ligase n=1 Tax=Pyrobaculum aerophilum TaxID=13773 RepID=A0A832SZI1_9CREN|nr:isoleucine--tRNA ligase [Pyrobaculum aerophilum]MCX8136481.1 isoleucine--tRNA ligase [Pyrobaculum aerophilum]HII46477.1 isoleucine--tRNA ligase [Pyrobaculum aerophilum]
MPHGDLPLPPSYRPHEVEKAVEEFWRRNRIFEKWKSWRGGPKFTFLEGPPTTNGMPHVGHIRGRTYKDVVIRFYRLLGYDVWVQGGWDMQGMPVEWEVEKKLKLRSKKDIEQFGLEKFALECNSLVEEYLAYWREWGTKRLGLWLDLENAYETRQPHYLQYAWRIVKRAHELGLLTEDYRVLWFCPRCETSLSDHEVALGYDEREDPSIYVKFRVEGGVDEYLVIWTTTPWTIVDNEAVAVHPDYVYAKVEVEVGGRREYWWLAEALVPSLMAKFGIKTWRVVETKKGVELAGVRYIHPLAEEVPERASRPHQVVTAEFVTLEQGTGLVHIAPGHGPEDFELAKKYGLPVTNSVEINGIYNELGGRYKGKHVYDVDKEVTRDLRSKGLLVFEEKIRHEYPHCWRCGSKLILRADRQWFIAISRIRDKMYAELQKVNVVPTKLRDRFDIFVQNARDWNISRSRVWGTPLPVWRCKKDGRILVIGSLEELKKLAKELPPVDDFKLVHRPWIDQVKISAHDCDEWVREPYVMDVWLDSGIAWIAAVDGENNRDLWEKLFPYDFVTEGIDQTRGWFYSLLATSVLYTGRAPYKNVLIQGLILDKHGQKMSKSKGNVIWAKDLFEKYGADPVRLYILSKVAPWEDLSFDPDEVKYVIGDLNILWNVVKFADTYMSLDGFDAEKYPLSQWLEKGLEEDKWILSELNIMISEFTNFVKNFEFHKAAALWREFVVETLSHRYIRLLRRRVWSEEPSPDKYAAYAVLHDVLKKVLILGSILVPFITEYLWQAYVRKYEKNAPESVHLAQYPAAGSYDKELIYAYRELFAVFSALAEARNKAGIKLRWPIREAYVNGAKYAERYTELLKYLGNVKEVKVGRRPDYLCVKEGELEVCVPDKIEPELYYEALARELIRRIQVMRKETGLEISDEIHVVVETNSDDIKKAVEQYRDYIARETRAVKLIIDAVSQGKEWDISGEKVKIEIRKAQA